MSGKVWTNEEIEFLVTNYGEVDINKLSSTLDKSIPSIYTKAMRLGIYRGPSVLHIKYTQQEFLDAIQTSKTHSQARAKLGYKSHGRTGTTRYDRLMRELKPDTSHFSLQSRARQDGSSMKSNIEALYNNYKNVAKRFNREFTLTLDEFSKMVTDLCYYCNSVGKRYASYHKKERTFNGVDRIDNNRGYEPDNCVSCCQRCNIMKKAMHKDLFLLHIKDIYENRIKNV